MYGRLRARPSHDLPQLKCSNCIWQATDQPIVSRVLLLDSYFWALIVLSLLLLFHLISLHFTFVVVTSNRIDPADLASSSV